MGFFSEIGNAVLDVLIESNKPLVSNPETYHDYTSSISGDIAKDDQYLDVFRDALRHLATTRRADTYIQEIMRRTDGRAMKAVKYNHYGCGYDGHFGIWQIYYGHGEDLRIILRLSTPQAIQRFRDGRMVDDSAGYTVSYGYEAEQKRIKEAAVKEDVERENRRKRPVLESFLGVKFESPVAVYAQMNAPINDMGNGLAMVAANVNLFMDFEKRYIIKPFDADIVVGVACTAQLSDDGLVNSYMQKVSEILDEKYKRPCEKRDDDSFMMHFYKDEGLYQEEYATIKLFKKDNGVVALYAVDAVNCGTAMSRYDAKQEKEKQERDDATRRDAIAAL